MPIAPWPSTDHASTCDYCGARVTDRFCRIFGDTLDRVHHCSECDSYRRLTRGSAAGEELAISDPETSPGRHGAEADI